jgi:phosphate starvation-inducible membrane PsiE
MSGHEKGARGAGPAPGGISPALRERIAQSFTRVEDVVYVGLGVLLAAGALILLINAGVTLGRQVLSVAMPAPIIELLDRVLLVVMLVELLYTVQISFREHTLVPEPFLIVGLIAATRRILVVNGRVREARAGRRDRFPLRHAGAWAAHGHGAGLRHGAGAPEEALPARGSRPGLRCEPGQAVVSVTRRRHCGGARMKPGAGPASRADAAHHVPGVADGRPP